MSKVLAIDDVAHGEAIGLRRGEEVLDDLPYADGDITEAEKKAAYSLIAEEVHTKTNFYFTFACRFHCILLPLIFSFFLSHFD